jgi:hypothetical protein
MKKTIFILILLLIPKEALPLEVDKAAHFGLSFALTEVLYRLLHHGLKAPKGFSLGLACGIVFAGTAFKEFHDPNPDGHDILANTAGISSAALKIVVFEF